MFPSLKIDLFDNVLLQFVAARVSYFNFVSTKYIEKIKTSFAFYIYLPIFILLLPLPVKANWRAEPWSKGGPDRQSYSLFIYLYTYFMLTLLYCTCCIY